MIKMYVLLLILKIKNQFNFLEIVNKQKTLCIFNRLLLINNY